MPYTVFPLFGITRDAEGRARCMCSETDCPRPGKHPAYTFSKLSPGEQVFGRHGHGIVTGMKSGIFVLDTDGAEADARFRSLGALPETLVVRTPSGGCHYYFTHPGFPVRSSVGELDWSEERDGWIEDERGRRKKSTKLDVRGEPNAFVVAPSSPHESGKSYDVECNVPPAPAPAWLLAWSGLRGREYVATVDGSNAPFPVDVTSDLGRERVELGREACAKMPASVQGNDGSGALWDLSLRLIRDLELPIETAAELVAEVFNPRCDPQWNPSEISHKLTDARDKSTRLPGLVPEGFLADDLANAPIKAPPARARRTHDPAHRYECSIGDVCNGGLRKTAQAEITAELFGNPAWAGVLQYDEFRDRVFAVNPPIELTGAEKGQFCDEDLTAIIHWFACMGHMSVTKDGGWNGAMAVAKSRANRFHPLREYLAALPPCEGAIAGVCDVLGLSDPFDRLYVRRFLIAAVRRALEPGCKVDNMLVLKGDPGLKKSTFVIALFGQEWTSENLTNIDDAKASGEVMAGKWAIEIAELKDIMRAGNETVAAFITRRVERYRAAYARGNAVDYPRSCVLVGSTNETEILRNATGADARRFWIVEPTKIIDVDYVAANRDRVWGEALALATAGEPHWLDGEEAAEHMRRVAKYQDVDAWHDIIENYCKGRKIVRREEIFKYLGGTLDKFDGKTKRRLDDTLRRLGCVNRPTGKTRARAWHVPTHLSTDEPDENEQARRAGEAIVFNIINEGA